MLLARQSRLIYFYLNTYITPLLQGIVSILHKSHPTVIIVQCDCLIPVTGEDTETSPKPLLVVKLMAVKHRSHHPAVLSKEHFPTKPENRNCSCFAEVGCWARASPCWMSSKPFLGLGFLPSHASTLPSFLKKVIISWLLVYSEQCWGQ